MTNEERKLLEAVVTVKLAKINSEKERGGFIAPKDSITVSKERLYTLLGALEYDTDADTAERMIENNFADYYSNSFNESEKRKIEGYLMMVGTSEDD